MYGIEWALVESSRLYHINLSKETNINGVYDFIETSELYRLLRTNRNRLLVCECMRFDRLTIPLNRYHCMPYIQHTMCDNTSPIVCFVCAELFFCANVVVLSTVCGTIRTNKKKKPCAPIQTEYINTKLSAQFSGSLCAFNDAQQPILFEPFYFASFEIIIIPFFWRKEFFFLLFSLHFESRSANVYYFWHKFFFPSFFCSSVQVLDLFWVIFFFLFVCSMKNESYFCHTFVTVCCIWHKKNTSHLSAKYTFQFMTNLFMALLQSPHVNIFFSVCVLIEKHFHPKNIFVSVH